MSEAPRPKLTDSKKSDPTDDEMLAAEEAFKEELLKRMLASMAHKTGATALDETVEKPREKITDDPEKWAKEQYKHLKESWKRYGVEIPSQEHLKARLERAPEIIDDLVEARPELTGSMGVLLVPPSSVVNRRKSDALREKQGLIRGRRRMTGHTTSLADQIDPHISPPPRTTEWRVMVTDFSEVGHVYLKAPSHIMGSESFMLGGHNTNGMGEAEYRALSLQADGMIDRESYTWLLKDFRGGPKAPVARAHTTVVNPKLDRPVGQYYGFEFINSKWKDHSARFRPTVEITEPDAPTMPDPTPSLEPPKPIDPRGPDGSIPMPPGSTTRPDSSGRY